MKKHRFIAVQKLFSKYYRKQEVIIQVLTLSAISIFPALIFSLLNTEVPVKQDPCLIWLYLNDIFIAPTVETLIFQLLPFQIARFCKWRSHWRILAMVAPFAIAHESGGYMTVATAAFAGCIFTLTFHIGAAKSIRYAACLTFSVHASANAIAYFLDYLLAMLP